jgi:hypothetical protein
MLIIDNALPDLVFKKLKDFCFSSECPWYYGGTAGREELEPDDHYTWSHNAFMDFKSISFTSSMLMTSILSGMSGNETKPFDIYRIRLGLITKTKKPVTHTPHCDMDFKHMTGLIYLNDSDGPTVFYNEFYNPKSSMSPAYYYTDVLKGKVTVQERVLPKENRMVLFNGFQFHSSTSPLTVDRRIVLNFNYIYKEK